MVCPGVWGGWSQALTCAVGCQPVISSPRGMKKKGCCILWLSLCSWGQGEALPAVIPFLAVTVTSIRPLG